MFGIIGGTSLLYTGLPDLTPVRVHTPFGSSEVLRGDVVLLLRHQHGLPPHRINFRANMAALAIIGVDRIIAFGSAGSLKDEIPPGSLVIPSDYLSLAGIPSIHDHAIEHVRPGLDIEMQAELDEELESLLGEVAPAAKTGKVYVQTPGPRIETMAEVRALSKIADVVGMTVASEATLASELDMRFAAICTVDNYAHGMSSDVLDYDVILETSKRYSSRTGDVVKAVIERFA